MMGNILLEMNLLGIAKFVGAKLSWAFELSNNGHKLICLISHPILKGDFKGLISFKSTKIL